MDLSDNAAVVDYTGATPLPTIRSYIQTGYAGGAWTGSALTSSAAAVTPGRAIGYAEASTLFTVFPAMFEGQTVDSTSVLLLYTLAGDTNLDTSVNIADFARLAATFNAPGVWFDGDFNYDGTVAIGDFSLLAVNFNKVLPADVVAPPAAVPEPGAAFAAIGCVAGLLLARRRAA